MEAQACYPSTQVAESGGLPQVIGQPWLHNEFSASLNYPVRPYIKKIIQRLSKLQLLKYLFHLFIQSI